MQKTRNISTWIKSYFPENKHKWKSFLLTALPVMLSSMIFALNAFVDNFMSTTISGGNQALSYANTWTEIEVGIIALTTIVGTTLFAQYLGQNDERKVKEVICMRILFAVGISLVFAIPTWITPDGMVKLISGFDDKLSTNIIDKSSSYILIITASWILNAIWYTLSMVLREKHHGGASFISSLISLIANIVLNSIFVIWLELGINFLAISTIIANILGLIYCILYMVIKDRSILINPLKIFIISSEILKQFFSRSISFICFSISSIAITIRFTLFNIIYPTGTIGESAYQISAATVLGISGMFFNIFWTMFDSINANVAIYVGKHLGSNNFDEAQLNAKQLQGFNIIVALVLSALLFILTWCIPYMTFMADGYKKGIEASLSPEQVNQAVSFYLETIKETLWPLVFYMPMFIWFITRSKVIAAGGHTNIVAITESICSCSQLGWIAIIGYGINGGTNDPKLTFQLAYSIFFISDICKVFIYEVMIKKVNWVKNITEFTLS